MRAQNLALESSNAQLKSRISQLEQELRQEKAAKEVRA